jgi:hypothetical protein
MRTSKQLVSIFLQHPLRRLSLYVRFDEMTVFKLAKKQLPVRTRSLYQPSFKSRSILGTLVHVCRVGPFCRRKKVSDSILLHESTPPTNPSFIIHGESGVNDLAVSSPTPPTASHKSDLPCGIISETHVRPKAETSNAAPKTGLKRNRVILSDCSDDDNCSAAATTAAAATVKDPQLSEVEWDGDDDSIDLLEFNDDDSSDQILSDDNDFINDESSSACSSRSEGPPNESIRNNPIVLKRNKNPLPPCERCMKKDGERFRCSECNSTYHEVCGGPGPSCTLCSECACALGVDPTQLSSDSGSDRDSVSSVSSSSSNQCSSSSEGSDSEYKCAVCHENDCGYIRACRVCGTRSHEYCGGPGPLHRKCDRYFAFPHLVCLIPQPQSPTPLRLLSPALPLTPLPSCMKQRNQKLPKRGSSKVLELGADSSSACSASDDGGCSSEGSDCEACVVCGETDGEICICKGCKRLMHEICGGPGPCHKLCDECSASLAKPQSRKGLHGMQEL